MRKVLLTALLAALPTAAVADWEFTKWGMTEAQVVAAAKGRTVPTRNSVAPYRDMNARCPIQIAPYDFAGFHFDKAEFCFDSATGKLVGVYIVSDDTYKFAALDRAIRGSLGQPVQETPGGKSSVPTRLFNDSKKGNSVVLTDMGVATTLTYRPLATGF